MFLALIAIGVLAESCGTTQPAYYRESGTGLKRYYKDDLKDPKTYQVINGHGTFNRYRYHY